MGDCYFMASASAVAEWPNLINNIFLTKNKNKAGIFAVRVFIRGKPYVISVDDSTAISWYTGKPKFGYLSDDGSSAWGIVLEKVWAKVLGNYIKTNGGYLSNGLRFLTGNPVFSYTLSYSD